VSKAGAASLSCDANGHLIEDGSAGYRDDAQYHPVGFSQRSVVVSYGYDAACADRRGLWSVLC
jgi:hypothetical protein